MTPALWLTSLFLIAPLHGTRPPPPQVTRVVSLAPTVTEIVCALGACSALVGVTRYDDYPPEVVNKPKIGGFVDPSLEAVLGLKPDVVVLNPNGANQVFTAALDRARVAWLAPADTRFDDFAPMVTAIAEVLHRPDEGRRLIAEFQRDLALIAPLKKASALLVFNHHPFIVAGPGSFGDEVLARLGLDNAYRGNARYGSLELEALLSLHPTYVIDVDMGTSQEDAYRHAYKQLARGRTRLVYVADAALLRLGPRLPRAIGRLGAKLENQGP